MKYITFIIIFIFSSCSCKRQEEVQEEGNTFLIEHNIDQLIRVELRDTAFRHVDELLHTVSYTILSNEVPLGETKRIIIEKDLIFVLDDTPKIVCFNLNDGSIRYKIDKQGAGPKEYQNLLDIALDTLSQQLIAYDDGKRQLVRYDLSSGEYIYHSSLSEIAPMNFAFVNGALFYDNPDHYNYPDNKSLHYSLLYSNNKAQVNARFFPHDDISDYNFNYGDGHPFFYNQGKVLYNKRFDNTIYEINAQKVSSLYKIELPDSLPLKLIKDKIKPQDLIRSDYSWGLSRIFECNGLLHLWFTKAGKFYTLFYDTLNNRQIYAGNRVSNNPVEELLVYYPISGVYKDVFFSLSEPQTIIEKREINPSLFPSNLMNIKEEDNPVVFFYKPVVK